MKTDWNRTKSSLINDLKRTEIVEIENYVHPGLDAQLWSGLGFHIKHTVDRRFRWRITNKVNKALRRRI